MVRILPNSLLVFPNLLSDILTVVLQRLDGLHRLVCQMRWIKWRVGKEVESRRRGTWEADI